MKRVCLLALLLLFSAPADAGDGLSISIGGRQIHIDSARCRSLSCVSVSGASRRDGGSDSARGVNAGNPPATAAAPSPPPIVVYRPAPVAPPPVAAALPPSPPPGRVIVMPPPPVVAAPPAPATGPAEPARPPRVERVVREADDEPAAGPIGDWQTETNGLVRIRLCGQALCGYVLDQTSRDLGEAVLINMKPDKAAQWSGSVTSHASGNIYYGTIELKAADRLRVAACVLGRFYCTRADWKRVSRAPQRVITERRLQPEPRS